MWLNANVRIQWNKWFSSVMERKHICTGSLIISILDKDQCDIFSMQKVSLFRIAFKCIYILMGNPIVCLNGSKENSFKRFKRLTRISFPTALHRQPQRNRLIRLNSWNSLNTGQHSQNELFHAARHWESSACFPPTIILVLPAVIQLK